MQREGKRPPRVPTNSSRVHPSVLIGAATAISVGISSAIQTIRDRSRPEDASQWDDGTSSYRSVSLRRSLNTLLEEKKEDPFTCGLGCEKPSRTSARAQDSMEDSTYSRSTSYSSLEDQPSTNTSKFKISPSRVTWEDPEMEKDVPSPSPIARMRNGSSNALNNIEQEAPSPQPVRRKSPEEIKREKKLKWKKKMKIARRQKMSERRILDGDSTGESSEFVANGQAFVTLIGSQVLNLIDQQCGVSGDMSSDSEESVNESVQGDTSRGSASTQSSNAASPKLLTKNPKSSGKEIPERVRKPSDRPSNADSRRRPSPDRQPRETSAKFGKNNVLSSTGKDGSLPITAGALGLPGSTRNFDAHLTFVLKEGMKLPNAFPFHHAQASPERSRTFSDVSNVSSVASAKMDIADSDFVKVFIHDMVKIGFQFFWQKDSMMMTPSTVVMRVKPGCRTPEGGYCGPRLVWQESEFETYGVNLFDIQKLERAKTMQLRDYPYSYPSRAVFLRMNQGPEFIFEAPTENDAMRFVHGMRWLLARLTFNLVIGNIDVVFELLEEGTSKATGSKLNRVNWVDDSRRSIAMDDMSEQLVERSVTFRTAETYYGAI